MSKASDSQEIIIHEIPRDANESSKRLGLLFAKLNEKIETAKWNDITNKEVSLNYCCNNGNTEIIANLRDKNNHLHRFIVSLQHCADNEKEEHLSMRYCFEYFPREYVALARSFPSYISVYLAYEGFEFRQFLFPNIIKDTNGNYIVDSFEGLDFKTTIEHVNDSFISLIEIVVSRIKPLWWFFTSIPKIETIEEAYYYLATVQAQLQLESVKCRWKTVNPDCFKIIKDESGKWCHVGMCYEIKNVWNIYMGVEIEEDESNNMIMSFGFNCFPCNDLSSDIKSSLEKIFGDFLLTIDKFKNYIFIGSGEGNQMINIQYFHIEDTFEILCSTFDEIVPKLQEYEFHLPLRSNPMSKNVEEFKLQMEEILNSDLSIINEEVQINNKLKHGRFK